MLRRTLESDGPAAETGRATSKGTPFFADLSTVTLVSALTELPSTLTTIERVSGTEATGAQPMIGRAQDAANALVEQAKLEAMQQITQATAAAASMAVTLKHSVLPRASAQSAERLESAATALGQIGPTTLGGMLGHLIGSQSVRRIGELEAATAIQHALQENARRSVDVSTRAHDEASSVSNRALEMLAEMAELVVRESQRPSRG